MQAKPDGYTLTTAVTPLTILPHQVKTAFTYKSFDPVINIVSDPSMFLVRADAPWKTMKEFLDQAKKNPGMISVGNSGAGGGVHLVALAFEKAAGVKFNHIPFSGGGPSVDGPARRARQCRFRLPARGDQPDPGGKTQDHRPLRGKAIRDVPQRPDRQGAGGEFHHGDVARSGRPEGDAARR